jgi:hypothetical protein
MKGTNYKRGWGSRSNKERRVRVSVRMTIAESSRERDLVKGNVVVSETCLWASETTSSRLTASKQARSAGGRWCGGRCELCGR